jgi:hypothetical protein
MYTGIHAYASIHVHASTDVLTHVRMSICCYYVYLTFAQVVLRINCLSTEFSSQKGVKGIPLHFVTDTYEDIETDSAEPVHRAYCKVKIFRDKVIIIMLHMRIRIHIMLSLGR